MSNILHGTGADRLSRRSAAASLGSSLLESGSNHIEAFRSTKGDKLPEVPREKAKANFRDHMIKTYEKDVPALQTDWGKLAKKKLGKAVPFSGWMGDGYAIYEDATVLWNEAVKKEENLTEILWASLHLMTDVVGLIPGPGDVISLGGDVFYYGRHMPFFSDQPDEPDRVLSSPERVPDAHSQSFQVEQLTRQTEVESEPLAVEAWTERHRRVVGAPKTLTRLQADAERTRNLAEQGPAHVAAQKSRLPACDSYGWDGEEFSSDGKPCRPNAQSTELPQTDEQQQRETRKMRPHPHWSRCRRPEVAPLLTPRGASETIAAVSGHHFRFHAWGWKFSRQEPYVFKMLSKSRISSFERGLKVHENS